MKQLMVIIFCIALTACGYKPLYQEGDPAKSITNNIEELSQVRIDPIDDRLGQIMRNRLLDILGTSATENYRLSIQLSEQIEGYGFRQDGAVTQEQVLVTANVRLYNLADNVLVYSTVLEDRTSFDVALSDFATVTQREDAKRRLVVELANQLHRRLALHFSKE